jgi:hypothetical protein
MTKPNSALQAGGDETPVAKALREISNWLVCWPIASVEDMAHSFPYMSELAEKALACPVAPAGVPTCYQVTEQHPENKAFWDGVRWAQDGAVLSAGAPVVPLQDEQHSSSVHLIAPGSTVPSALTVGTPLWISVDERMPEPDTECLVYGPNNWFDDQPFIAIDTWREQREAPVGFSSATVPIGLGWDDASSDDSYTHWMPLPPPPVRCDGRDGVTDSGASSEAREATPASNEQDGNERCEDCGDKLPKTVCYCREGCFHALSAVAAQPAASGVDALWVHRLRETAAHLRGNSLSLAKFPGMGDEARARELAALYIGEIAELYALKAHLSTALTGAAKE